jgi:hypothetical protein
MVRDGETRSVPVKITIYKQVPISAEINFGNLGRFLARTGWELVQIGEYHSSELGVDLKLARWTLGGETITIRDDASAGWIAGLITRLAELDGREPADVLQDIVGHELLDRGTAINRLASAGARLVDATERGKRIPKDMAAGREIARVRRQQAEQDVERATAALRAAEAAWQ